MTEAYNKITKSVLDQSEIDLIYKNVGEAYDSYVMERYGQQVSNFRMPESALRKIEKHCEEIFGISGLVLEAYQFSRYEKFTKDSGEISMPRLIPHYDGFPEQRYTFDYQIGSNTSWPLVVENEVFTLSDNEALTFSGTHQIHWRLDKNFEPGEFVDMIFCHLYEPGAAKNSASHPEEMERKQKHYEDLRSQ
jgi:hypothetical protein